MNHSSPRIGCCARNYLFHLEPFVMKRTILLSICLNVLGSQIAAAAEMPKFDIAATCLGSGGVQTPAKCMEDEQAARDQVAKQWSQFKQSDASRCVQITTSRAAAAGYVALLGPIASG